MNLSWLTIRDLEYVLAVAEHLHFAKGAASCHVSQPALSTQIKKVEDHLGIEIFERTNRRVATTEPGKRIIAQARVILDEVRRLGDVAAERAEPLQGTLRLGAIATLGPYLMPILLPPLRKKYPGLSLFIKEGLTPELIDALKAGELDAVLAADTFHQPGLTKVPLFHEPFSVALPKGHPLEKSDTISPAELRPDEMVLLEDGHCLSDQALELCRRGKGVRRGEFQATSLETLRHLVASGLGYTLIPALALPQSAKLNPLIQYRPIKGALGRKVILVYRESTARAQDMKALADSIRSNLPDAVTII